MWSGKLQKRFEFEIWRDLLWVMKRPLSTKDKTETGIFGIFSLFSKTWKIRDK